MQISTSRDTNEKEIRMRERYRLRKREIERYLIHCRTRTLNH